MYLRALAISEKAFGPGHPSTGTSLNNLAGLYRAQGMYAKAEPLYARALAISEKAEGPEHRNTWTSLINVAGLYSEQGEYAKAAPLYVRALAISEKVEGPAHPNTGVSLNSLAALYFAQGAYARAEPLFVRALAISKKAHGPGHPNTGRMLNNLAELYKALGAFAEAEPLLVRALAISEALGPEHPSTVARLSNLAGLYESRRAYAKAEPFHVRALAISEKVFGPNHPKTGTALHNMASMYYAQREYAKAEPLYLRALAISEEADGPEHPFTASTLNNLAGVYHAQGAYSKAEPLYLRALAISKKADGPEHPSTGKWLNNLAELYRAQGAHAKAEPLYLRALAIQEKALGQEHPETIVTLENLALLEAANGAWASTAARLRRLNANQRHRADLSFGRDTEKGAILTSRQGYLSISYAGAAIKTHRNTFLPILLQTIVSSKARLADEMRAATESLRRRMGPEDRRRVEELEAVWQRMSEIMTLGERPEFARRPRPDIRRELQDLNAQASDLTAHISAKSAEFRTLMEEPTPAKLAAALAGRPLIEIARVSRFQPKGDHSPFGDAFYLAAILLADGRMDFRELGEADEIDRLVDSYRSAQEVVDNAAQAEAVAEKLGSAILAPIIEMLGDSMEWYLSPDGALRLIPIGALRVNRRYASEQFKIWTISSGRDLLTVRSRVEAGVDDVILANPRFGAGDGGFAALPETEEEAEAIRGALPSARIVEEGSRTKKFLMEMPRAPRILHLATHAFYRRGGSGDDGGDPLLRGGIALDGANAGVDGILMAKEAQSLRLEGTQLAVMSACETGVGEVSFGEGLIGLQRSLMMAGARSQLLTLWPVNSARTRDLMARFYRKLAAGMPKGEALVMTQRELIAEGVAPHFWAPFVLYGDPGPLEAR